jgi:hypothetical protein
MSALAMLVIAKTNTNSLILYHYWAILQFKIRP